MGWNVANPCETFPAQNRPVTSKLVSRSKEVMNRACFLSFGVNKIQYNAINLTRQETSNGAMTHQAFTDCIGHEEADICINIFTCFQ